MNLAWDTGVRMVDYATGQAVRRIWFRLYWKDVATNCGALTEHTLTFLLAAPVRDLRCLQHGGTRRTPPVVTSGTALPGYPFYYACAYRNDITFARIPTQRINHALSLLYRTVEG